MPKNVNDPSLYSEHPFANYYRIPRVERLSPCFEAKMQEYRTAWETGMGIAK
jgi:hypothetical protein